jgi:hypothetical protein
MASSADHGRWIREEAAMAAITFKRPNGGLKDF